MTTTSKRTGVYQIRNLSNGKVYIGSAARSFSSRWSVHVAKLRTGTHSNKKLQNAWNKYGPSAFVFEPLLICTPSDCLFFEQLVLDAYDAVASGYNINPKAGSALGYRHTEEAKARTGAAHRGQVISAKTRQAVAKANSERVHSEGTRQRLSNALTGREITPQWRENIRTGKLGKRLHNNGVVCRLFKEGDASEGFVLGKL